MLKGFFISLHTHTDTNYVEDKSHDNNIAKELESIFLLQIQMNKVNVCFFIICSSSASSK